MKRSGKRFEPDHSQTRITSFFARQRQNNVQSAPAETSGQTKITQFMTAGARTELSDASPEDDDYLRRKSKRRKVARLVPPNCEQPLQLVDLTDSDEEKVSLIPFSPSKSQRTTKKSPNENAPSYVRVEEFRLEVDLPLLPKTEAMEQECENVEPGIENMSVDEPACDSADERFDPRFGLISIRPIKQILDDSQGSATSVSLQTDEDEDINLMEMETQLIPSPATSSIDSGVRDIFLSPVKAPKFVVPASPVSAKKTPRSRVNKLSPIKALQSSRASSKTPTKKLQFSPMKSPAKGGVSSSPIKSLFAQQALPYYLKHFLQVLNAVVEDTLHANLLNEEDLEIVKKFKNLSKEGKCLYVRLIGRKWEWKRMVSIKYEDIATDLQPIFEELHREGFVSEIKDDRRSLIEVLEILDGEGMAALGKKMNVKQKQKETIKRELLKRCTNQGTLHGSMESVIYESALKEVSCAYKLNATPKHLFSRIFMLYLPPQYWDQEDDKDTLQLLSMLLADMKKLEYPVFKIIRTNPIYTNREEIILFHEAWTFHAKITGCILNKLWLDGATVANTAFSCFKANMEKSSLLETHGKLPVFLRAYVPGSLLARVSWMGVDCLQKQKKYKDANEILEYLLNQRVYLLHYRGRWYERLIVNSKHLKKGDEYVLQLIQQALEDDAVKENYRLELTERYQKLHLTFHAKKSKAPPPKLKPKQKSKSTNSKKKYIETSSESDTDFEEENEVVVLEKEVISPETIKGYSLTNQIKEITIEGEKMPMFDREYGKSVFLGSSANGNSLSSVEEFAISHYKSRGFDYSVHAEGAVPCTIYGLIFWDIIYHVEIPDVFRCPYQALPLDLMFQDFYIHRKVQIDEMLQNIRASWTVEQLLELMEQNWDQHRERLSIVSWTLFETFDTLKTLIKSMGLRVIAGICERLARDYRHYRSGFPDLMVWNETKCCFAEVKGPGDKLSSKQRIWLDYLVTINADVEICYVKAVSNKRLRF